MKRATGLLLVLAGLAAPIAFLQLLSRFEKEDHVGLAMATLAPGLIALHAGLRLAGGGRRARSILTALWSVLAFASAFGEPPDVAVVMTFMVTAFYYVDAAARRLANAAVRRGLCTAVKAGVAMVVAGLLAGAAGALALFHGRALGFTLVLALGVGFVGKGIRRVITELLRRRGRRWNNDLAWGLMFVFSGGSDLGLWAFGLRLWDRMRWIDIGLLLYGVVLLVGVFRKGRQAKASSPSGIPAAGTHPPPGSSSP